MKRTRPAVTAVAAILLLALGGAATGSAQSDSDRLLAATCSIAQLEIALGPLVSEKTEQHTAAIILTNIGARACTLNGYPTLTLTDVRGRVLPFAYGHRGDQMITAAAPTLVTVDAGRVAFFELNKNTCVGYTNRAARSLHVGLPGAQGTLTLRLPHYPILDYCPPGDPGHAIIASPIEAQLAAAGCRSQRSCRRSD